MSNSIPSLFPDLEKDLSVYPRTGILPSQDIQKLIAAGHLHADSPVETGQVQPSSIDLRLGPVAYRVRASFLPNRNSRVQDRIQELKMHEIDISRPAVLERGCVYIVPLQEQVRLPEHISGKANPKSTTGRLDIFTRLLTDHGTEFERIPPGYEGRLYAEIVPRTFSILVCAGNTLSQLRFMCVGTPYCSDAELEKLHREAPLVYVENGQGGSAGQAVIGNGLWVSVDLQGTPDSDVIGYKAKKFAPLVDLSKVNHYDPLEYWDPILKPKSRRIILDPDDFYILASKQRVLIPPHLAAEMVAYDPSVGEFRVHYAGFFDPGFGYGQDGVKGARAVLEVRSHEVPFLLEDDQLAGRLIYEALMSEPERTYGTTIGSSYQGQGLSLSKQFRRASAP